MVDRHAAQRFLTRQRRLLERSYDDGWEEGVTGYEPDPNPARPEPPPPVAARVGIGVAAATLLARRARAYRRPRSPDDGPRTRALAPALAGLEKMAAEMSTIAPSADDLEAARVAVDAGAIGTEAVADFATARAVADWLGSNASRLDAGESVAWAGEQQGYADAADADGMLLEWQTEEDEAVCEDCADLGTLPPMPLADFPTIPGQGDTECNVGCRCSLEATDAMGPGDVLPNLTDRDSAIIDRVAQSRAETLVP